MLKPSTIERRYVARMIADEASVILESMNKEWLFAVDEIASGIPRRVDEPTFRRRMNALRLWIKRLEKAGEVST